MRESNVGVWIVGLLVACGGNPTATADEVLLTYVAGNAQQTYPSHEVAIAPAVKVTRNGVPVAGVTVVFEITSGGGQGGGTAVTDADGIATSGGWTLGPELGEQRMVAHLADRPDVKALFSAYAARAEGAVLYQVPHNGYPLRGEAGTTDDYSVWIEVHALDATPLAGEAVRWSVLGPATIDIAQTRTGSTGRAQLLAITYTGKAGSVRVFAEVLRDNIIPQRAEWTITVEPGPVESVTVVQGDHQVAPAGSTLPLPIRLKVEDRFGNIIAKFGKVTVVDGGGTIGGDGYAEADQSGEWVIPPWTLGPTPGRNAIRIDVGPVPFEVEATGS